MAVAQHDVKVIGAAAAEDVDTVGIGGKAAGLAFLVGHGARVPAFCVVPVGAFRAHLHNAQVLPELGEALLFLGEVPRSRRADAAALQDVCTRLRGAVERAAIDRDLRASIETALGKLGPGPYAIRSSMVGEDSAAHSFAGQLRTELFQVTLDDVADAVRRCWASAFTPQTLVYAARAGIAPTDVHLALVLQAMIDSEVAGVAFSANPLSGARDECVVTAAYGLGEGVVADLAPADTYVWSPVHGERSAQVRDKDVQVRRSASERGTEVRSVAPHLRSERALTSEQVAEIAGMAKSVAAGMGRPVDVEWCVRAGELYVLQARPITALPPNPAQPRIDRVFDNSNIQESFNGVTTPLTFSFAARLYEKVYTESLRTLGASERTLQEFEPVARRLLGLIDGRVFYNLASWRQLIESLPQGRRRVAEIEAIMFRTSIGTTAHQQASLSQRLKRGGEVTRMVYRLAVGLARQDAVVDGYIARFQRFYDRVDRGTVGRKSLDELGDTLEALFAEVVAPAAPAYRNDLRVAIVSGRVRKLLVEEYGESEADARLGDILGGIAGLESVEPTRQLMTIARDIRLDDMLLAQVSQAPPAEVVAVIRGRSPEIAARIDSYLERYGDRMIGELKLESVSLREDSSFLGAVLHNYARSPNLDPDRQLRVERERAAKAMLELSDRLPEWRRGLLKREVELARRAVSCRERLRLRRTWTFAIARDLYGAVGVRLHEAGVLDDPRDVLYLSVGEIDDFIDGRAVSTRLAPIAAARKAEFEGHARTQPPDRFQTTGNPYLEPRQDMNPIVPADPGEEGVLRGLGCCAGVTEAKVRIILDPSESLSLDDEILCTVRTDPGWAPLFPTASGLIVERGSILSHSAVVARELGIPTVVGIPGVTRILCSGERVRLDGGAGLVERLDAPEGS